MTDVLIAGGGPVGLMLACELRLRGVDVTVLERLAEPSRTIKAGSVNGRTVDAFDRRGLRETLDRAAMPIPAALAAAGAGGGTPKGHFAGIFTVGFGPDELPTAMRILKARPRGMMTAGEPAMLSMAGPHLMMVAQVEVERVLAERAAELGVAVRRGVEVVDLAQDDAGVSVELGGGERLRARYLVGCDGGRSTVRKRAGFGFPGTDPTMTGHQALLELDDPDALPKGWHVTDHGLMVHGPVGGRVMVVEFDGPPVDRDAPVTVEELQASIRRVSGTQVRVLSVTTATRFTDNARLADTYRLGRVLLAGDAAHVHSPFGGQGLNLGVQDAANLGWKLALVLAGQADEALLDTYTAERRPVADAVLANTRAQVALLRPDPLSRALRDIVVDLMDLEQVVWHFSEMMSGLGIRYGDAAHPMVGRHTPDLGFDDGARLAELCHDGRGVLVDLADDPAIRKAADGWADRVRMASGRADAGGLTALLVRPDGYLAWVAERAPDLDTLDTALHAWFGTPTRLR